MPAKRVSHNLLGDASCLDNLVEVVARLYAHFVTEVNEIFGRNVSRRATVATIWTATHATKRRVEFSRAKQQSLVIASDRRTTRIVQVHVKGLDVRILVPDSGNGFAHRVRHVPSHCVQKGNAIDLDTGVSPFAHHEVNKIHSCLKRKRPFEVRSKWITYRD